MPPSPRYTVRLPHALDAQVQARVQAGTTFAVLIREALSAYLADTPPTAAPTYADRAPTPADRGADSFRAMQDQLTDLTTRVKVIEEILTQWPQLVTRPADSPPTPADTGADRAPTPRRQRADRSADRAPTGADPPPATLRRAQRLTAETLQTIAETAAQYNKLSLAELAQLLFDRHIYRARDRQTGEEKPVNRGTLTKWLEQARRAGML